MKRNYYLFIGQHATTPTPNVTTGNLSYYGDEYKFRTLQDRKDFINENTGRSSQEKIVVGDLSDMRSMNLGMSVQDFTYRMSQLDYTVRNNNGEWV